jgi:hypothetical protein
MRVKKLGIGFFHSLSIFLLVLVLTIIANNSGETFFVEAEIQDECAMGPDGTCTTTDTLGDTDKFAEMKVTTSEDGTTLFDIGFGVAQTVVGERAEDTKQRLLEATKYMKDRVLTATEDDILSQVAGECQLRHENCAFWAVIGECEKNPGMFLFPFFAPV